MVPEDLLVWLEACDPATLGDDRPGLLCRRHADAMVVPVGWTLDDHREPVPRLFKVREMPAQPKRSGDHTGRTRRPKLHQASLLDLVAEQSVAAELIDAVSQPDAGSSTAADAAAPVEADVAPLPAEMDAGSSPAAGEPDGNSDVDDGQQEPGRDPAWSPTFDHTDDLDGLLAPRGKLLRRAFGAEPPR